jgi:hypothetical protein
MPDLAHLLVILFDRYGGQKSYTRPFLSMRRDGAVVVGKLIGLTTTKYIGEVTLADGALVADPSAVYADVMELADAIRQWKSLKP